MLEDEADAALAHARASVTSSPSKRTVPASGASSPAMIRSSVVLPEPDGPEQRDQLAGGHVEADVVAAPAKLPKRLA